MFIVELENNVWLAPWYGDPGRTIVKENAARFKNYELAEKALKAAKEFRNFEKAKIIDLDIIEL